MRAFAAFCATALLAAAHADAYAGWLNAGGDNARTSHGTTITKSSGLQWKYEAVSSGPTIKGAAVVTPDGKTAIFADSAGVVYAVSVPQGSPSAFGLAFAVVPAPDVLWKFSEAKGAVSHSPALSPDGKTVFVASQDTYLYSLDVATGKKKWAEKVVPQVGHLQTAPIATNTTVFLGANNGVIAGYSYAGKQTFSCLGLGGQGFPGGATYNAADNMLYVTSLGWYTYGFDLGKIASTGGCTLPSSCQGCASFYLDLSATSVSHSAVWDAPSKRVYVTVDGDGSSTKSALWSIQTDKKGTCPPPQTNPRCQSTNVCECGDNPPESTSLYESDNAITTSACIVDKSTVAFGTAVGEIIVVDVGASPAKLKWKVVFGEGGSINSDPVSDGSVIAFGSQNGHIFVVSATDGSIVNEFSVESKENGISAPPAIDSQGNIIVGAANGHVWSVGGDGGSVLTIRIVLSLVLVAIVGVSCWCCIRKRNQRKNPSLQLGIGDDVQAAPSAGAPRDADGAYIRI